MCVCVCVCVLFVVCVSLCVCVVCGDFKENEGWTKVSSSGLVQQMMQEIERPASSASWPGASLYATHTHMVRIVNTELHWLLVLPRLQH